jgi:hypothetical protein
MWQAILYAVLRLWIAWPSPEPPLDPVALDLSRFPPPVVVEQCCGLASAHVAFVRGQAALQADRWWYPHYVHEAERRQWCWSLLWEAQQPTQDGLYDFEPADSLLSLRLLIGEANYAAGRMPLPMPCMDTWGSDGGPP